MDSEAIRKLPEFRPNQSGFVWTSASSPTRISYYMLINFPLFVPWEFHQMSIFLTPLLWRKPPNYCGFPTVGIYFWWWLGDDLWHCFNHIPVVGPELNQGMTVWCASVNWPALAGGKWSAFASRGPDLAAAGWVWLKRRKTSTWVKMIQNEYTVTIGIYWICFADSCQLLELRCPVLRKTSKWATKVIGSFWFLGVWWVFEIVLINPFTGTDVQVMWKCDYIDGDGARERERLII